MAKKSQEVVGTDKGKIRLIYAEVEGNNQSLQDALKSMVAAMNRPQVVTAPSRINGNSTAVFAAQAEEVVSEDEFSPDTVEDVSLEQSNETSAVPARKRGTGPKVDRNAGIKLVPDLDFVPDGKQPLKAFFAEKDPKKDMEQVLVLMYYMHHTLALPTIGLGHILTAFKEVVKPVPVDLRSTVRNMRDKKVWLSFTDMEATRVTTQGDNYVEHELGT
jgi:hypothetical protein